jgi:hypothetical protein
MENNIYKTELTRVIHSTGFDYDFMEGMKLSGNIGWDRYNLFTSQRIAVGAASVAGRAGSVTQDRYTNDVVNTDIMWTGKFNLTDDILSTFIAGQQLTFTVRNRTYGYSEITLPFYDEIGAGISKDAYSARYEDRIYSYYAQGTFNAWDRLTLTGAVRRDAGSTFGKSNPVYYYPKASIAYRISEESFMQDLKGTVDELKLRLAWGKAGRIPDRYASNSTYTTAGYYDPWERSTSAGRAGQLGIINDPSAGTEDIKPEQTQEIETGLDASFLDHRIGLEFNYYKQYVTELLLYVNVPTSTGYNQQYRNAGEMWNQGIEVKLEVIPIKSTDFTWIMTTNYARNKNEVTKLEGFENSYTTIPGAFAGMYNVAKVGKPLGIWMGAGYQHDASGKVIYSDPADPNRQENFWGTDDNNDPSMIKGAPLYSDKIEEFGKSDPDWTGSFRNNFSFFDGDLNASVLFEAAYGQKVWNGTKGALYNFGTAGDTKDRDALWFNDAGQPVTYEGPNTISIGNYTYNPGEQLRRDAYYQVYANGFYVNEPFVEDGSYIKLREVSISYRWRNPLLGLESIVFTVSGRNLKTWTDYTGYDPEVNTFAQAEGRGFDYFTLPQIRSYNFNITINY